MLNRMVGEAMVQDMKKMLRKTTLMLIMVAAMMACITGVCAAKENDKVPEFVKGKSDLKIEFCYSDDETKTPIPGATFTAYQVATVKVSGGYAKYALTSEFKDTGVNVENMTAEESMRASEIFRQKVVSAGMKGVSALTDARGIANFGEVDNGIYLILETAATGEAAKYSNTGAWLLEAPELVGESGSYEWNYNTTVYPKPVVGKYEETPPKQDEPPEEITGKTTKKTPKQKTDEPDETTKKEKTYNTPLEKFVKTGDENSVMIFVIAIMVALAAVAALKKAKDNK